MTGRSSNARGDVLGPILFTMFIAAIMMSWRKTRNHPQCLYRTKDDYVMTGRSSNARGDVLGPILFTMFIAAIMMSWRKTRNHPQCLYRTKDDYVMTGRSSNASGDDFVFGDSEYADDTAALFDSEESIRADAPGIDSHFLRFGMEVHAGDVSSDKDSKTEVLYVSIRSTTDQPLPLQEVKLDNSRYFPVVSSFSYLGTIITSDCKDCEDVLNRIKKAGNMFGALKKCLFGNKRICFTVKGKVYESLILSILLYGSESWCLTEDLLRLLKSFHNRCVRSMCRVSMSDVFDKRITTKTLLDRLELKSLDSYVVIRQLRWAGHVA